VLVCERIVDMTTATPLDFDELSLNRQIRGAEHFDTFCSLMEYGLKTFGPERMIDVLHSAWMEGDDTSDAVRYEAALVVDESVAHGVAYAAHESEKREADRVWG
jgi:hypothetical protein